MDRPEGGWRRRMTSGPGDSRNEPMFLRSSSPFVMPATRAKADPQYNEIFLTNEMRETGEKRERRETVLTGMDRTFSLTNTIDD
jgi:hypothetical protein